MQSILNQSNFLKIYQKSSTLSKREAFQEISGSALKNVIPKMYTQRHLAETFENF